MRYDSPVKESTELINVLLEVEDALSKCPDEWHLKRRRLCEMWRYVLETAPRPIQATAAEQIAFYHHPKAELSSIGPDLQYRVEMLALKLFDKARRPPPQER